VDVAAAHGFAPMRYQEPRPGFGIGQKHGAQIEDRQPGTVWAWVDRKDPRRSWCARGGFCARGGNVNQGAGRPREGLVPVRGEGAGPFSQPVSPYDKVLVPRQLRGRPRVEHREDQSQPRCQKQSHPRGPAGDPGVCSEHRMDHFVPSYREITRQRNRPPGRQTPMQSSGAR